MMFILLSMLTGLAAEPSLMVEGRVVDAHGHPLVVQRTEREAIPAVSLAGCAGTRDAVRLDGSFAFALPPGGCSLVVSAPGYRARTVSLGDHDGSPLKIALEPSASAPAAPIVVHRGSASPVVIHPVRTIEVQSDGSILASAPVESVKPAATASPATSPPAASGLEGLSGSLGSNGDLSALMSQLGEGADADSLASLMSQLQSGEVDPAMLDGLMEGGVLDVHPGAAGAPANAPDLQQILESLQKLKQALK